MDETRTEEARTEGPVECGVAAHDHDIGVAGVCCDAVVQAALNGRRESGARLFVCLWEV